MRRVACLFAFLIVANASAAEPIRFVKTPAVSPDGALIAFEWNGDLWLVASNGGEARQLTLNPGRDTDPKFSPDGKTLAFLSDREGSTQVFTMPATGGTPTQLTFHTSGYDQVTWMPDGRQLLVRATRDFHWRRGERFFLIGREPRSAETLVFDDYGSDANVSPDGKKILFSREGEAWWRKGYVGSRVSQIWSYDVEAKTFTKILHEKYGSRWPMWRPDGLGFYFVQENAHGSNLAEYDFGSKAVRTLTTFPDESVVFLSIARDGSVIAFRRLFDLYAYRPATKTTVKLDVFHNVDRSAKAKDTRLLTTATDVTFTNDGLEMAFIAGGDLWVMDTELREPIAVTKTPVAEARPLFTPDGQNLIYVVNSGDSSTIVRAKRGDPKKFWWQNATFPTEILATFKEPPTRLKISPDGKKLAYVVVGDLFVADVDLKNPSKVVASWNPPDYDWSPDGKWLVYSVFDSDFNSDVWIIPSSGGKAVNISRHPYNEGDPVWSPDGKMIAFAGQRASVESGGNIAYVYLQAEDDDKTSRDRKIEKALDKMKGRPKPGEKTEPGEGKKDEDKKEAKKDDAKKAVVIDFDGLPERVRRVSLGEGSATTVFWSPDSKKIAFTGSFQGKGGTYTIDVGDSPSPTLLTSTVGQNPVWLKQGNQIVWLVQGVPTSTPGTASAAAPTPTPAPAPTAKGPFAKGAASVASAPAASGGSYTFSVRQDLDIPARNAAIFDESWRIMRDQWYDAKHNNRDWDAVRAKYRPAATAAVDAETLSAVIHMMLGELNGSHLGFTYNLGDLGERKGPRDVTPHLGLRFDPSFAGPGLRVRDVLPTGPADRARSKIKPGEIVKAANGVPVDSKKDLTAILNGPLDREITLTVENADGKPREVTLRPITYVAAQNLLYDQWLDQNRKLVDKASNGKLGYLHISQMSMPTFRKFEEELVSQGSGKDGLIIDVRENPGGSTADHLLTALTQPVHAITVPRGGGPGYPHDRKIYQTWSKPIVVLCNQNSGSNAEIFSHAIRTLKRGTIVGVPTAGAVISTGSAPVMDVGTLRLPFRGWFVVGDGKDMELNGAQPHHILWPEPGDLPQGRDAQLTKAIDVLLADVAEWQKRPQPKLKYAAE